MPDARDYVPYHIDSTRILERPELSAHLALISVLWNRVEENAVELLPAILSRHELVSANLLYEVVAKVINFSTKQQLIMAAANVRLTDEMYEELSGLMKEVGNRQKERNDYVHSSWHICPDIPDVLVRVPRRLDYKTGKKSPRLMVYNEVDFKQAEQRLIDLAERLARFGIRCVELREASHQQSLARRSAPPNC